MRQQLQGGVADACGFEGQFAAPALPEMKRIYDVVIMYIQARPNLWL